jgi:hypothetical protein
MFHNEFFEFLGRGAWIGFWLGVFVSVTIVTYPLMILKPERLGLIPIWIILLTFSVFMVEKGLVKKQKNGGN